MKTKHLELYTDYLLVNAAGYATATGLSNMMEGDVSHDEITRLLSQQEFSSKNLDNWGQSKIKSNCSVRPRIIGVRVKLNPIVLLDHYRFVN